MRLNDAKPRKSPLRVVGFGIAFLGLLVIGFAIWAALRVAPAPTLELASDQPAIGKKSQIHIKTVEALRGVERVVVELSQGEKTIELADESFEVQSEYRPWDKVAEEHNFDLEIGTEKYPELVEGDAVITVRVINAGTWLKDGLQIEETLTLPVRIKPPALSVLVDHVFVAQGGCEVVVYTVGPTAVRHGVRSGKEFFPGYDLPGSKNQKFAFFAAPYDLTDPDKIVLVAADDVDNEARRPFVNQFTPRPFKKDTINVSTRVMERVVPKIAAAVPSFKPEDSVVESYVAINSKMRTENRARLRELAKGSAEEFMWDRTFVQMSAKAVSAFADHRTYKHEGKKIDEQFHLGFDLASTARAPIPAANPGKVLLAEYLGIYGNVVVLDHGYGIMSLYAHLSSFEVEKGDTVKRAQVIGRTGATGLALGDHLHFAMLLHGLPVTALEWWDGHWIQDRIALKLGKALSFKSN